LVINDVNSGSTFKQWAKGFIHCSGDYIWIAESDDLAHPDFLVKLVAQLDNHEKAIMSYCQSYEINNCGNIIGDYCRHTDDLNDALWNVDFSMSGEKFVNNYLIHRNCIPNVSAILFRRDAFHFLDNKIKSCKYIGDWIFYIKILKNRELTFISDKLNYFRTHLATTRSGKTLDDFFLLKEEFSMLYDKLIGVCNISKKTIIQNLNRHGFCYRYIAYIFI